MIYSGRLRPDLSARRSVTFSAAIMLHPEAVSGSSSTALGSTSPW